ncbi:MAG: VOC family protein [Acidimicrobiales bacterium]
MSIHHIALATSRMADTHAFYTEAMGFELVKAVVNPTPEGSGWAKHVFYETGDGRSDAPGMIAFWDLHGDFPPVDGAMSGAVGLPTWVNHLAFHAEDESHLDACRKRWLDLGLEVVEIDHGFCRSIYTNDPNGTAVEWCLDTRPLDEQDRREAAEVLAQAQPDLEDPPTDITFHAGDPDRQPDWSRPA